MMSRISRVQYRRLTREYVYNKNLQGKLKSIQEKKDKIRRNLDENTPIHPDLRESALHVQRKGEWGDTGPEMAMGTEMGGIGVNNEDDEYRWAGVEDPKILISTSRKPNSTLRKFVKELRLILPNSQKMNRGKSQIKKLIEECRTNGVTDLIIVQQSRDTPDGLVISHLPYGPTAYFTLSGVIMRHDIPNIGTMPQEYPHLIFHNFKTKLGQRAMNILKYLFPVPKKESKRVITFANHDDYIHFGHHTIKSSRDDSELSEVGPRFQMKLYKIHSGTLENEATAEVEWALNPYMNTSHKRRFLSDEDGLLQEDHCLLDMPQTSLQEKKSSRTYTDLQGGKAQLLKRKRHATENIYPPSKASRTQSCHKKF